jgi:hypothetical protein
VLLPHTFPVAWVRAIICAVGFVPMMISVGSFLVAMEAVHSVFAHPAQADHTNSV